MKTNYYSYCEETKSLTLETEDSFGSADEWEGNLCLWHPAINDECSRYEMDYEAKLAKKRKKQLEYDARDVMGTREKKEQISTKAGFVWSASKLPTNLEQTVNENADVENVLRRVSLDAI